MTCSLYAVRADAQAPILVLESHVGTRPASMAPVLGEIDDQLEARGFAAKPAAIFRLAGPTVARPGVLDLGLTTTKVVKDLQDGYFQFVNGDCDTAITLLRKGLAEADRNPELLVSDATNLDTTFNSMVALAVCLRRKHDPDALQVIDDVIRRFPSRPVSRQAIWGKEGEMLYVDGTKDIATLGRGRITVAAGSTDNAIFIDGQSHGQGHVSLGDFVPGLHHVFIWVRKDVGRQYTIDVKPGEEKTLDVKPGFDAALSSGSDWVGFEFSDPAARRAQAEYASAAALRWTKNHEVAVLATVPDAPRPAIDGVFYRDGVEVRRARVYVDTFNREDAEKLAQFLASGNAAGGLEVIKSDLAPPPEPMRESAPSRTMPISLLSVGGVGVIGGALMIAFGGPPAPVPAGEPQQKYYRDYREPGYFVLGGGVAAAAVGLYFLLWHHQEQSAPVVEVSRDGAMFGWSGSL
jgi:hypothetical protein